MAQSYVVVSIRDAKAESFSLPFFQANKALALRTFRELSLDPKSQVNRYPEDYAIFQLGTFDDCTGSFDLLPQPLHLANALDFSAAE